MEKDNLIILYLEDSLHSFFKTVKVEGDLCDLGLRLAQLYNDVDVLHLIDECPGKAKDLFFPVHLLLWLQSDFSLLMWLCDEQSLKGNIYCWCEASVPKTDLDHSMF